MVELVALSCEDSENVAVCKLGGEPSPRTKSAVALIGNSPASITARNKCVETTLIYIFVMEAQTQIMLILPRVHP